MRGRSFALVAATLILGAASCRKPGKKRATDEIGSGQPETVAAGSDEWADAPPSASDLFLLAEPDVVPMPVPARFSAPLPATVDELDRGDFPSKAFINGQLATNANMRMRVLGALVRASSAGALPDKMTSFYEYVLEGHSDVMTCRWLLELGRNAQLSDSARSLAWGSLGLCSDPTLAPDFSAPDIPDAVVVRWFGGTTEASILPYRQRVADAAIAVARTSSDFKLLEYVGHAFGRMHDERSVAAVRDLQKAIGDPTRRAIVTVGMKRSPSPYGFSLAEQACAAEGAKTGTCMFNTGAIDDQMPDRLLAVSPKETVVADLERCVLQNKKRPDGRCLEKLAMVDRARAVRLAKPMVTDANSLVRKVARDLVGFPDLAAAEKELIAMGFALDATGSGAPTALFGILGERGRTTMFISDVREFPAAYDGVLAQVAGQARPVLDDVVFEQVPPANVDGGEYILHAYADGRRYALRVPNSGKYYDASAILGLVNALLVARKSELRAARLSGLPTLVGVDVLVGPTKGIQTLVGRGLLDVTK